MHESSHESSCIHMQCLHMSHRVCICSVFTWVIMYAYVVSLYMIHRVCTCSASLPPNRHFSVRICSEWEHIFVRASPVCITSLTCREREREREGGDKAHTHARVYAYVVSYSPQTHTVVSGFALDENTCLYEQVLSTSPVSPGNLICTGSGRRTPTLKMSQNSFFVFPRNLNFPRTLFFFGEKETHHFTCFDWRIARGIWSVSFSSRCLDD